MKKVKDTKGPLGIKERYDFLLECILKDRKIVISFDDSKDALVRGPERRALVSVDRAVYAPTVDGAIDKAIIYSNMLKRHAEEVKALIL
jgi:hypothetical protein